MLCNSTSYYPDKVDDMVFFQDNNLETVPIMEKYQQLIAKGKFSEAAKYINQQKGVYGYFADFFNMIENRISKTQEYLWTKPAKIQPFVYYAKRKLCTKEAISIDSNENNMEDLESIYLCSDSGEEEALDLIWIFTPDGEAEPWIYRYEEEIEPPNATLETIWI